MAEKKPGKPDNLRTKVAEARENLDRLNKEWSQVTADHDALWNPSSGIAPGKEAEFRELENRQIRLRNEMLGRREWYSLYLLESLESSAGTLNKLTWVLISLTIVLAGLTAALLARTSIR